MAADSHIAAFVAESVANILADKPSNAVEVSGADFAEDGVGEDLERIVH